jgi:hypothetical protein
MINLMNNYHNSEEADLIFMIIGNLGCEDLELKILLLK